MLDVLTALANGPATLPAATLRAARSSMDGVLDQLRRLEAHGLIGHKSRIKSGHLVPEFFISETGKQVLRRAGRGVAAAI